MEWHKPEWDTHFTDPDSYQLKHWRKCHSLAKQKRTVIDCGAHIGIHTKRFAAQYDLVIAIEPINTHSLEKNTLGFSNVKILNSAVGNRAHTLWAHCPSDTNSGAWELTHTQNDLPVGVITIDSLQLTEVDVIKIDTQGLEQAVLEGASQTLQTNSPIVWIEDRGKLKTYMKTVGYTLLDRYQKESYYGKTQ